MNPKPPKGPPSPQPAIGSIYGQRRVAPSREGAEGTEALVAKGAAPPSVLDTALAVGRQQTPDAGAPRREPRPLPGPADDGEPAQGTSRLLPDRDLAALVARLDKIEDHVDKLHSAVDELRETTRVSLFKLAEQTGDENDKTVGVRLDDIEAAFTSAIPALGSRLVSLEEGRGAANAEPMLAEVAERLEKLEELAGMNAGEDMVGHYNELVGRVGQLEAGAKAAAKLLQSIEKDLGDSVPPKKG